MFHADALLAAEVFAVNAESRMSCGLRCVDAQRPTLTAAPSCGKTLERCLTV